MQSQLNSIKLPNANVKKERQADRRKCVVYLLEIGKANYATVPFKMGKTGVTLHLVENWFVKHMVNEQKYCSLVNFGRSKIRVNRLSFPRQFMKTLRSFNHVKEYE